MAFYKYLPPIIRTNYSNSERSSVNHAVLSSINDSLNNLQNYTTDNRIQSFLNTATGNFLDEWGEWFGVPRKTGQSDIDYRNWIIDYVLLKKGSKNAIIYAIKLFLNLFDAYIDIEEPYKEVMITDQSKLDDTDHLSGSYYRWGIINIIVDQPVPVSIYTIIREFKPAGVNFYITIDESKNINSIPATSSYLASSFKDISEISIGKNAYDYQMPITGYISSDIDGNLFTLDKSKLDDVDVITGNELATNGEPYNYGTYVLNSESVNNLSPSTSDTKSYLDTLGTSLNKNLYTTGATSIQGSISDDVTRIPTKVGSEIRSYVSYGMSVFLAYNVNYSLNTYSDIFKAIYNDNELSDKTRFINQANWIKFNLNINNTKRGSYSLFLYNFSTNKLDLISSQQITSVIIANLTNYINSSGYLYLAIQFISTIKGNYTLTINNPTFIINNDLGFNPQTTYSNSLFEIKTKQRNGGTPFKIGTSAIGSSYISSSKS